MTNPMPYLVRMLLFLAAVLGLAYYLHEDLLRVFRNTPDLDSVILLVLLLGIFFIFRQVVLLWPEINWLRRFQHREENSPVPPSDRVNLLAPLAAMMGERQDPLRLSPTAARAVLDGIATRLDERRELARYLIGLLIFLGLLGTFWGLLQTIGAVADAINGLQVSAGDAVTMFAKLKGSIEGPLKGMSTAFGASLFGLSGSLVLGFLELQASQAQGRFHTELEEWLARATNLSSPALPAETAAGASAYVEALLERNAEGLDAVARTLLRIEESRQSSVGAGAELVQRLASLAETMRTQQNLLARFTELSIEMRSAVNRLGDRTGAEADREALAAHQRNLEANLNRLIEEQVRSRVALADEFRGGFGKLSDRAADEADRETLLARQREVEAQVAKLAEETSRATTQVTEEVREAVAKLSDRGAQDADRAADRAAIADSQREMEAQVSKLAEENARHQADLIAELRNMAVRVADRTAAEADRDALLAHQRTIEGQVGRLSEELQNTTQRLSERPADTTGNEQLLDRQRGLEDQIEKLAEELRGVMARLSERPTTDAERESLQLHQRNVEAFLARLSDENARARGQLLEELNKAVGRMPDRAMAEADRESLASHQRNIEGHLARLVDENARNRATMVDELRESIGRLSERFADNDREAVSAHQRNIESHLARLAEEASSNRTALADELRGEIRLLARTLSRGPGSTRGEL
jgi:protein-tyrosine-phosphatase